jgi:2-phospho-L-lactate/phosphoenolpyruvate guanylyltransferase
VKTVAVVPVKRLDEAKVRLSGALTQKERAEFVRAMLGDVLSALEGSGRISRVAVISPDAEELRLPQGVVPLRQGCDGLNNILEQGREWAADEGADALLVVFADLPVLTAAQIAELVDSGREPNTLVIAHDRHGEGTNAMLAHPPGIASFHFGPQSYSRHLQAATRNGASAVTYRSPGTTLDIDTPYDLEEYRLWSAED